MIVRKDNQEVAPFYPILSRLDSLDRTLKFLDDKYLLTGKPPPCSDMPKSKAVDVEDECISLSSALELVQQKGSVAERLEFLENRILQLSLEMPKGNSTSRTSSSTVYEGDEDGCECDSQDLLVKPSHKAPHLVETVKWTGRSSRRRRRGRKWDAGWRWLHIGCTT